MDIREFRDLNVWKLGKSINLEVYVLSKNFPKKELFGLTSQMRRAAISIPSNIAEGYNRFYKKEYQRFLLLPLVLVVNRKPRLRLLVNLTIWKLKINAGFWKI